MRRPRQKLIEACLLTIATCRLIGLSWFSSLVLCLAVSVLSFFGNLLSTRLVNREFGLGVSLVIGITVFVIIGQSLLVLGADRHVAHPVSLGTISLLLLWMYLRRHRTSPEGQTSLSHGAVFAIPLGLAAFGISQPWLLPFGLSAAVAERIARDRKLSALETSGLIAGVAAGWFTSLTLRPDRWWYLYQGHSSQYHETLSWSTAWWGLFDHAGYVGGTVATYHWFSFAFFGAISSLASLDPYVGLMKVSPIFFPTVFASLFLRNRQNPPRSFSVRWIVVLVAVLAMDTNRMESVVFALLVAFALISVVEEIADDSSSYWHPILLLILSSALFLSKVPVALVVGVSFALMLLIQILRREKSMWLSSMVLLAFSGLYSQLFMRGNDPEMWGRFQIGLRASLIELSDLLEPRAALNWFLWSLIPIAIVGSRHRGLKSIEVSILVTGILALTFHLTMAGQHTRYLGVTGIALLTVFAVWKLDYFLEQNSDVFSRAWGWWMYANLLFWIVCGYLSSSVFRRIDERVSVGEFLDDFFSSLLQSSGLILTLILFGCILLVLTRARTKSVLVLLVPAVLGVFAGQTGKQYLQLRAWGPEIYEAAEPMYGVFGRADLVEMSKFIRDNTSEDAVLASNQFCCSGAEWVRPGSAMFADLYTPEGGINYERYGGHDLLLPAHVRRRFLVQGLRLYLLLRDESFPKDEPFARVKASVDFANHPSSEVVEFLRSRNVTGYIVNLSLTSIRDWSDFADEKFRSGNYVYLEIDRNSEKQD